MSKVKISEMLDQGFTETICEKVSLDGKELSLNFSINSTGLLTISSFSCDYKSKIGDKNNTVSILLKELKVPGLQIDILAETAPCPALYDQLLVLIKKYYAI